MNTNPVGSPTVILYSPGAKSSNNYSPFGPVVAVKLTGVPFPVVPVTLTGTAGDGTPITQTVQTGPNGEYLFDNLAPGEYKLTFEADAAFQTTFQNVGGDDAIDSDVNPLTGMTVFETLTSGENNPTYDAGFYRFGSIGNFVWKDCDKDGLQGVGEEGLTDVPVSLNGLDGNGNSVSLTTSTDANGNYEFDNLVPGTYVLTFGFPATPGGLAYSPQDQGGNEGFDSDVDAAGMTAPITITSALILTDIDAGFMDVEAPTFAGVPVDETVECDNIPDAPVIGVQLTATDNCDTDVEITFCLLYTSPSPRDATLSRMPSSA